MLPQDWIFDAFLIFDRDRDGFIGEEDLRVSMERMGQPVNATEITTMIREADVDVDGRISFEDFAQMMLNARN